MNVPAGGSYENNLFLPPFTLQEAKNRPKIDWQEKTHRAILRGLRNISETPQDKGMKFLL